MNYAEVFLSTAVAMIKRRTTRVYVIMRNGTFKLSLLYLVFLLNISFETLNE